MSDFFSELMESIDSLTEEQVNALMSKLEVKRAGSQRVQEESKDEQSPMACPYYGSIDIKRHSRKSGRQRYLQRLPQGLCGDKQESSISFQIDPGSMERSIAWDGAEFEPFKNC